MKTSCCKKRKTHFTEGLYLCTNPMCDNYLGTFIPIKSGVISQRFFSIGFFVFYILFSFDDFSMNHQFQNPPLVKRATETKVPLNMENLEKELIKNEVICQKEVMAQILLESGNLGSELLSKTNNMLGMRYPFSRKTKACGLYIPSRDTIIYGCQEFLRRYKNTNNYAVYSQWQDAISDYKLWQNANFRLAERYLAFLGNVYAEDSSYVTKIKRMATQ